MYIHHSLTLSISFQGDQNKKGLKKKMWINCSGSVCFHEERFPKPIFSISLWHSSLVILPHLLTIINARCSSQLSAVNLHFFKTQTSKTGYIFVLAVHLISNTFVLSIFLEQVVWFWEKILFFRCHFINRAFHWFIRTIIKNSGYNHNSNIMREIW